MIYRFHFFSFHHSIISSRCRFLFWPRYYFYLFQECHITENVHFIITDIIIVIVTYINVVIYFIDSYIITTYISITYVLIYITITFIITFIVNLYYYLLILLSFWLLQLESFRDGWLLHDVVQQSSMCLYLMLSRTLTATLQFLSPLIPLVKVDFLFKSRNLINEALKKLFKVFAFFFFRLEIYVAILTDSLFMALAIFTVLPYMLSIFSAFENVDVFIVEAEFFRVCLIDQHSSACLNRCFLIEN